jgi:hypothetical protein
MNENKNYIGFVYRIDYIGNNPVIKNLSYAGSKKLSSKIKWDCYYGSPSKKDCIKCKEWKIESKLYPKNFKKEIIFFVHEGESITEKEIEYMKSVSSDIIKDEKWLNSSIPKIGAFPEFKFTKDSLLDRENKRKKTILEKTGKEHGYFVDLDKRKKTCLKKYNVDHFNKTEEAKNKNSLHKKQYFSSMSEEERKLHGFKSLKGRKKQNIILGALKSSKTRNQFDDFRKKEIENKRKEKWMESTKNRSEEKIKHIKEMNSRSNRLFRKRLFITIKDIDNNIVISDFMSNLEKKGYARDGIRNRIKYNSLKPLFSRKCKKNIIVISHKFISLDEFSRTS